MSDMTLSDAQKQTGSPTRDDDPITLGDWCTAAFMVAGGFAVWGLLGMMFAGGLPGA